MILSLAFLDSPAEFAAALLVFAFAMLVLVFLTDDDDLPGPRLFRVPVNN